MSKTELILSITSILTFSAGVAAIAVGAFFLKRLDERAFGDPIVFYAAVRHYGLIASMGCLLCLAGCVGFALAADQRKGFRAARNSALGGLATAMFGMFLFPIHNASGAVYFDLLAVTLGSSLIFLLVASIRWILYRTRLT